MSASMITMAYVRPATLIRSLKHQFSCLSVRGFQHASSQEYTPSKPLAVCNQNTKNLENNLDLGISRQCLNLQKTHEARFLNVPITDTIVDNIKPLPIYECPKMGDQNTEINVPSHIKKIPSLPIGDPGTSPTQMESPGTSSIEKLADADLVRVRRRKMRKHQQRRRKANIWPILRKQKYQKQIKKRNIFNKSLARIRSFGTNYDPLEEIKSNIKKAKAMGYQFDIFGDKSKTFGFLDDIKQRK